MKSEENLPLISIVITNYNYGKYLRESIESAINQTYKNLEIILIDDASTDNSRKIYERFREKIKLIQHKNNKGIVFSRNEALMLAGGEYIIFLDADDYWDNDFIDKMFRMARLTDADVIYPNWKLFGDINEVRKFSKFSNELLQLQRIHISPASLMKLSSVKPYRFENENVAEDWDFFLKLSLEGLKFTLASDCYIHYRIKNNSRSNRNNELDDIREFAKILTRYKKKYKNKVVCPYEIVLEKVKDKNLEINRISKYYEKLINERDARILENQKEKEGLLKSVRDIQNSRSYKLVNNIGRISRKIRSKND